MRSAGSCTVTAPRRNEDLDMSLQACAEILHRGDPDRFLATMAAPAALRVRLLPLYAFNVEVARAPWVTQEPLIAEMRLQWWHDALDEIATGRPVRAHEVVTELAQVLTPAAARDLQHLVEARRWDITREPFPTVDNLRRHLWQTSGRLLGVAGQVVGAPEDQTCLQQIGTAQGLAQWLLSVPNLAARGLPVWPLGPQGLLVCIAQQQQALGQRPQTRQARQVALTAWRAEGVLRRAVAMAGDGGDAALTQMSEGGNADALAGALGGSEFRRRVSLLWASLWAR